VAKKKITKRKKAKRRVGKLLSIQEVADKAGVVYETAGRWVRSKKLRSRWVTIKGRQKERRILESDLNKFIKRR